jgi:hypothetical protein
MALQIARLCLGLLIAAFHVPIANFVLRQEDLLIVAFRRRGLDLPTAIPRKYTQNLFFGLGILVALIQLLRIHQIAA